MTKGRMEAFSDGVIAIIITVMVLELKVPHDASPEALRPVLPPLLTYAFSFLNVGIYWNNHHHMLHATTRVSGGVLWANLHLLFWLSLVPFTTGWIGENHFQPLPTAVYGLVLLLSSIAYYILARSILAAEGPDSKLAAAIGNDVKGRISSLIYLTAVPLAFVRPWVAVALYVLVSLIWLVPDRRIERRIEEPGA
ncbi:MAG TPA: TMEM175 family protein [Polyangia bacterium]|nr:TMEM175 family protein [Polyangia bacterium]